MSKLKPKVQMNGCLRHLTTKRETKRENDLVTHLALRFHYPSNEPINLSEVTDLKILPNHFEMMVQLIIGYHLNSKAYIYVPPC